MTAATYLILLPLALASATAAVEKAPQTLPGGWRLEWHDEFNGHELNRKKWRPELGLVRNVGAHQTYTEDSLLVKDGKLTITAQAEETPVSSYQKGAKDWRRARPTMPYKSGSITTKGLKTFFHGRLEVRAKLPANKGAWPAIWLINENPGWGWPQCGEIDIVEHASQHKDCCYATFHWGKNGGNEDAMKTQMPHVEGLTGNYHIYSMEWDAKRIILAVDGKETCSLDIDSITYPDGRNPFRKPAHLIINLATGGAQTMTEAPDPAAYPCTMEVDYVRYYVKKGGHQAK